MIINFVHDPTEAFEGILWEYRGGWMTLRDASALKAGQPPAKLNGDIVIHRNQVAYMQLVPS